jgi:hypothetical protein
LASIALLFSEYGKRSALGSVLVLPSPVPCCADAVAPSGRDSTGPEPRAAPTVTVGADCACGAVVSKVWPTLICVGSSSLFQRARS